MNSQVLGSCMYTAQGKIICERGLSSMPSPSKNFVESFVNLLPNEEGSDCKKIQKSLTEITSKYNCNTSIQNENQKCSFKFTCADK